MATQSVTDVLCRLDELAATGAKEIVRQDENGARRFLS